MSIQSEAEPGPVTGVAEADNAPPETDRVGAATRSIAGAAMLVMFFFVLSRVTGLAREIVIGARFGTGAELDAYLAAFRLPDLLFQLAAGGALGSAFIPTFSAYLVKGERAQAWLLFSRVLNLIVLILLALAVLAAIFAGPLVEHIIAPGFPPEQQALTASLMRWMLVSTVIFGASGLVMGALNALQHFLLPAAAPVVYNLAIIGGAWLLAPRFGIYGLVIGVVAGALGHFLVQLPGLVRQGVRYTPSLTLHDAGVREVARLMGPRVLGLFFVQLHFLVNTILASNLAPGSLSALNFAWLLMLLPQGVFAQSLATATFPTFAAQFAADQHAAMRRTFSQTLRTVFFLTIPAAVGLIVLGAPLVRLLLERGEFTPDSTHMVVYALRFYALGLIAHAGLEIVVRAFYALHDTLTPVAYGVAAMLLNILLSVWWVNRLGYGGLALANSTATTLEMLVLLLLLRKRMGGMEGRRLVATFLRSLIAALAMGGLLYLWLTWLAGQSLGPIAERWLPATGGLFIAALAYAAASLLLRNEAMTEVVGLLRRRRR
ncbi:MAG: murein biosynthesis integral membrane protein MurJ [Caldilineaceae bacterium]|nr:murein biosynthesis integral membrane protein MurJ [Caldilineaceae bacterium]